MLRVSAGLNLKAKFIGEGSCKHIISCMATPSWFSFHFYKGNNFYKIVFVFKVDESLFQCGPFLKAIPLKSGPH